MILTTTNSIEGFSIIAYNGIVSGIAVNIQKTKMTFNMQKYYAGVSESITEIKEQAFTQLKENAEKLNANAIVGITVDIEQKESGTISVIATGTAVSIVKKRE